MQFRPERALAWMALLGVVLFPAAAFAVPIPFVVDALAHSTNSGLGSGLNTGLFFNVGDPLSITVDPDDLWNAGPLPRWSNADGLTGNRFATGSDESGQPAGTLIGQNFGILSIPSFGLSAPFGTLVGSLNTSFFVVGTSFNGVAPDSGFLHLYYWDSFTPDNTQWVTAFVDAPEPGVLALGGLGVLALAVFRRRRGETSG